MKNQLSVFNFRSTEVRTIVIDDNVWFVASDIAKALNYAEAKDMTRVIDEDEQGRHIVPTPSGDQEMIVINESGMYHAVLKSRKPEAKPFRKWVTSEVLPAIRKTGSYSATITREQAGEIVTRMAERFPVGKDRPYAWSRFNNHFRLASYKDLPATKFSEALYYIGNMETKGGSSPVSLDIESAMFTGMLEPSVPTPESVQSAINLKAVEMAMEAHGLFMEFLKRFAHHNAEQGTPRSLNEKSALNAIKKVDLGMALTRQYQERIDSLSSTASVMEAMASKFANELRGISGRRPELAQIPAPAKRSEDQVVNGIRDGLQTLTRDFGARLATTIITFNSGRQMEFSIR